jgi:hypothetical protein
VDADVSFVNGVEPFSRAPTVPRKGLGGIKAIVCICIWAGVRGWGWDAAGLGD